MLTTDRRAQILEILRQNGSVTVSKLAEKFETSESTIRRDLLALSQLGKINKVHGGATVLGQEFLHNEEDFNKKSLMNINEKEAIAKYAALPIQNTIAATGLVKPKVPPTSALPASVSNRKPRAMRTPPPTTNGSICETPFMRCLKESAHLKASESARPSL